MIKMISTTPKGKPLRIGIVQSTFSDGIGSIMLKECLDRLRELGVKQKHIVAVRVPGALEIPLALQNLALSGRFDALIALGVVIRGETYHFELVANESGAGISRVGLDFNIPIANAVLTTENEAQALARMVGKAREAADVATGMAGVVRAIGQWEN